MSTMTTMTGTAVSNSGHHEAYVNNMFVCVVTKTSDKRVLNGSENITLVGDDYNVHNMHDPFD